MPDPLDNAGERAKKFLREDPFQDASGANPFGDPNRGVDRPSSANPYATATESSDGAQRPKYVTTQESRGSTLIALGIAGMLICLIGIVTMPYRHYLPGGNYWLPIPFIGLAACVPAITFSYSDMLAMEAGAMTPNGWAAARAAFVLGLLGCLLAAAYALGIALVVLKLVEL